MKQTLIAIDGLLYGTKIDNSTAIAGIWEIDDLQNGTLAVFDGDGTLIDGSTPVVETDTILFALGADGGTNVSTIVSPVIDRTSLSVTKNVYVAPVAKVMVIGNYTTGVTYNLNLPTLTAGLTGSIKLVDLTKDHYDTSRYINYEYTIKSGETATSLVTAIVALINADTDGIVTADVTDADNGFSLTSKTAGKDFSATAEGVFADADVLEYKNIVRAKTAGLTVGYTSGLTATVVANVTGNGTYAQILELEKDSVVERGNSNFPAYNDLFFKEVSRAVSGKTYTVYTLTFRTPADNLLKPQNNPIQMLNIAIVSDDTTAGLNITCLDAIFDVL
jgi:hypothetical protein